MSTSPTTIGREVNAVNKSDELTPEDTPNTVGPPTQKDDEETGTSSQKSDNTNGQTSNGTPKNGFMAYIMGGQEPSGGDAESSEPTKQNRAKEFVNSSSGQQYNTTGGIQHNATNTATQFSGAVFSGTVYFHKPQA